jgi:hypothetical protein
MSTQASPGLNAPSAYDQPGGIPPNMSILAAMSAGIVASNVQPSNAAIRMPRALTELMSSAGSVGTKGTIFGNANNAPLNLAAGGGGGTGAGGANCDPGSSAGQSSMVVGQAPASYVTTTGVGFQG